MPLGVVIFQGEQIYEVLALVRGNSTVKGLGGGAGCSRGKEKFVLRNRGTEIWKMYAMDSVLLRKTSKALRTLIYEYVVMAAPMASRSSQARDETYATAATGARVVDNDSSLTCLATRNFF